MGGVSSGGGGGGGGTNTGIKGVASMPPRPSTSGSSTQDAPLVGSVTNSVHCTTPTMSSIASTGQAPGDGERPAFERQSFYSG